MIISDNGTSRCRSITFIFHAIQRGFELHESFRNSIANASKYSLYEYLDSAQ